LDCLAARSRSITVLQPEFGAARCFIMQAVIFATLGISARNVGCDVRHFENRTFRASLMAS
jgi:hypothetical protein